MHKNKWMGRRFNQWIENNLRQMFGDEWMLDNPPANFEVLLNYSTKLKQTCGSYEYSIANRLRKLGLPIEHQAIYFNRYIADLTLFEARTIIELDGPEHQFKKEKDQTRDEVFIRFGFDVHRWPMPMKTEDLDRKILSFFKAYRRFAKNYPLKPLVRSPLLEKAYPNGLVQRALNLKEIKSKI
ncbi:MAG: DUF559 domain-containing protein [Proteobacteria bacterium]|nr:DUF559 domain-containing protein [Pseudomonadota bacterium]